MSLYPEFPEPEEPESSKRRHGCLIIITVLVIIAMLGSALVATAWFILREQNEIETPITEPIAAATSIPETKEIEAAVAITATAVSTPTSPAGPAINRIVYIDSDGQIVTVGADGRDSRVVSDESLFFRFPAWSPDGEQIAAIGSNNLGSSVIVLNDRAGSNVDSLYFGSRRAPFYLYWAPDSQTISFLANDPLGIGLYLAAADGSDESRLRTTGSPFYWQWTADSQQILIHTGIPGRDARLAFIDAAGDEDGEQIAKPGFFRAPGISADGRLLAYAEELENLGSQVVLSNTTSGSNQTDAYTGVTAMSFSPTGTQLAYISPDLSFESESIGTLKLMDAAHDEVMTINRAPVIAFFWSPDGRYLAAFVPESEQGQDINAADQSDKTSASAKPDQQLTLPTLTLIVFDMETGEGNALLSFTPTLTFLTQFVPFFDQYALSHRIWSPASDAIVLPVLENGRSQIYVIPVQGGQKEWLAAGSMAFWSHQ